MSIMEARGMKKRRDVRYSIEAPEPVITETPEPIEPTVLVSTETVGVVEIPKPKRYSPKNCSGCTALRPKESDNYVSVYHTRRESEFVFHYCKCSFCNNTFKDIERT